MSTDLPETDGPAAEAQRLRKIIHVDMDAFFASVEQRDDPDLRGKPVAVGGSSLRGVVAAASYEARKFGVRSAMPSVTARRKCPELIFVKSRFEVYKAVSAEIREIFQDVTPLVEPLSLDEAYLDVTDVLAPGETATALAESVRRRIREATGLTASAGVSFNKFLAKTASGMNKPDGLTIITPARAQGFIDALPVGKFHGIGPATAERLHAVGIRTGFDLRTTDIAVLEEKFGRAGRYYHDIARGIDNREVKPDRIRKSVGAERTFSEDIHTYDEALERIALTVDKVWAYCEGTGRFGRTLTLKVKYADFTVVGKSHTDPALYKSRDRIMEEAARLLSSFFPPPRGVRLLGVKISSFEDEQAETAPPAQFSLFEAG